MKKPKNSQNKPYVAVWETTFDASYKAVILTGYSSKLIFFDDVFILTARALLPGSRMLLDHPILDFYGYMGTLKSFSYFVFFSILFVLRLAANRKSSYMVNICILHSKILSFIEKATFCFFHKSPLFNINNL